MNIVRVHPFGGIERVYSAMDRFFDEPLLRVSKDSNTKAPVGRWAPVVDIYQTDEELVFKAELPGFDKKDIEISVKDGYLLLKGERKFEEKEGQTYYQVRRHYGEFYHSFHLPTKADSEKISAGLEKGLLTITLPVKQETKPKLIEVKVH